jgi:hypothetical protein
MATPREEILAGPTALKGLDGIARLNALFANYCFHAKYTFKWSYVSTGQTPSGAQITKDAILDGTNEGAVYCEPLVYAFNALAKEAVPEAAGQIGLVTLDPCLLVPGLTCVDPKVVGNVRTLRQSYGEVRQCLFSAKHVFSRVMGQFYDPCFLTKYATQSQPIEHEGFLTPAAQRFPRLEGWRIMDAPPFSVFRPTPNGLGGKPVGFDVGFVRQDLRDLTEGERKDVKAFADTTAAAAFKAHVATLTK